MKRFDGIALRLVLALAAPALAAAPCRVARQAGGRRPERSRPTRHTWPTMPRRRAVIVRPSGLQFKIIQNGYGKRPTLTDTVQVYYTGTLINHVIFDGTSPGLPATFKVNGSVIPGWVEALQLMREGDHWLLVIPANLGYGARGAGDGMIPPNQTLIFDLSCSRPRPRPRRATRTMCPIPTTRTTSNSSNAVARTAGPAVDVAPSGRRPAAHRLRAGHGGGRQRAVLDQPRLYRGGAGMGRAGARHRLQSQPHLHRCGRTRTSRRSGSTPTWRSCPSITGHIRTYTVDGGMDKVPEIARRYGMTVSLGIWISPDLEQERHSRSSWASAPRWPTGAPSTG